MRRENVGEIFRHNGYPMRSHSETRWASMMDLFGIRWMYEPKLFKTQLGMYLPDFYLPDMDAYLEVKGAPPTEDEIQKAEDVKMQTGRPVIFAHGKPVMDGVHLIGAQLSAWVDGKPIHVPMYEISKGLEKYFGPRESARLALAGKIQPKPGAVSISNLLDQYLRSNLSRGDEEHDRADENQKLNALVENLVGPTTEAQMMVANVVNWLRSKITEVKP